MEGTYGALRRQAESDLESLRQYRGSGRRINPREGERLARIQKDLISAIKDYDEMQGRRPYSDTNIGYGADVRQRGNARSDADDAMRNAMDAIDRILPHIVDNTYNDMDANIQRGRVKPGSARDRRLTRTSARYDMDDRYADDTDDFDDNMDDDMDEVVNRRGRGWRPRRTRRGVGRFTQVRTHVRRMPGRRADMDDDMSYDDDRYDHYNTDARYDDARRVVDEARRATNDARRTADDARRTADMAADTVRRLADDARGATPVMTRGDHNRYTNARYDGRIDTNDHMDDDTADRTRRTGPDMRR